MWSNNGGTNKRTAWWNEEQKHQIKAKRQYLKTKNLQHYEIWRQTGEKQ